MKTLTTLCRNVGSGLTQLYVPEEQNPVLSLYFMIVFILVGK